MSLHQLIYLSKASRPLTSIDFLEILEVAKRNNASLGVTGSLFYNGGWFLQVLEGDVTVINSLYRRIEQDNRHEHTQIIYLEPANCRVFSRWTMNMINLETERGNKYDILADVIKAATKGGLVEGLSPAVKLLKVFSSDHFFQSVC
ncbi:hypothetical protein PCIT_b0499 [Pseudoalteromonas citrea]|uniref:BLUF domain-containing protein n=2 Tax=Pseudoalteromonas citrea TaxID=43655 RepID=A0AAD4AEI3_9GAMM|nr:BLUF domain-containing protein [Pseudoalteromonas citrea]KAF7764487.1 hypothetical protein PCIT_b0499 [Pseudoalteromonas citrea]